MIRPSFPIDTNLKGKHEKMSDSKKELIQSMDDNEQIYCDYCSGECTASSLKYGNTLMSDYNSFLWYRWDFICLDCSEKLCNRLDSEPELYHFMHTNALIHLGFEEREKTNCE